MPIDKIIHKDDIYHPRNREEVRELINFARENKLHIRTIGSAHSPQAAIYDKDSKNQIKVILDGELRTIKSAIVDESKEFATVSVNAGCYLGVNPSDRTSTLENSFNFQVDKLGYALPTLGGISHQTVAGFLQTSSSGGSAKHTIADAIEEIEWINGLGEIRTAKKGEKEFNAVVVSMGLFGVITNVTFKCSKKYLVEGLEVNREFKDSVLVKDDKGHHTKLDKFLFEGEYGHINYLPQSGVMRTMEWSGKAVDPSLPIIPYTHPLSSEFKTMLAVAVLHIGNLIDTFGQDSKVLKAFLAFLLKQFADPKEKQEFRDVWYKALPIDDQAKVDGSIKTLFSELWFPRDQLDAVMNRLLKLFDEHPEAAGNFVVELYCAKKSPLLLSPAHDQEALRVDLYWWAHNLGDPIKYFGIFWEALLDIPGAKLHWGKYMPIPGEKYGDKTFTSEQLYQSYKDFAEWNELRNRNDPQQLFVTDYWRRIFNIPTLQKLLEDKTTPVVAQTVQEADTYTNRFYGYLKYWGLYGGETAKVPEEKIATVASITPTKP